MIVSNNANNQSYSLPEKCSYSHSFWSTFSYIGTLPISSYSVRMPENMDQNNSKYGHFFTQWFFTFSCQCSHFFQCFSVFCCILHLFEIFLSSTCFFLSCEKILLTIPSIVFGMMSGMLSDGVINVIRNLRIGSSWL